MRAFALWLFPVLVGLVPIAAIAEDLPSFVGKPVGDLRVFASSQNITLREEAFLSSAPPDSVVWQVPGEGGAVGFDRVMRAGVSLGAEAPNLLGAPLADAVAQLEAMGLPYASVPVAEPGFAGEVVRQTPKPLEKFDASRLVIFLAVSEGGIAMPALAGRRLDHALAALRQAGLTGAVEHPRSSHWAANSYEVEKGCGSDIERTAIVSHSTPPQGSFSGFEQPVILQYDIRTRRINPRGCIFRGPQIE